MTRFDRHVPGPNSRLEIQQDVEYHRPEAGHGATPPPDLDERR
jgi:hypothetical protein